MFPGGLTMVLLAGSELFTGNTLLVIPLFQREITWKGMLKNWLFVYVGNLLGSILVAAAVVYCHQLSLFDNGLAVSVLSTAAAKCAMPFGQAFVKGICCNFLVCIAVWISFAAKDVISKIAGLFFPSCFSWCPGLSTAWRICISSAWGFSRSSCRNTPRQRRLREWICPA